MTMTSTSWVRFCLSAAVWTGLALSNASHAGTPLADQPVMSGAKVPGNLALALSVEFPTANSVAHTDGTYYTASVYLGYFDPNKCYGYSYNATESQRYFYPSGLTADHTCGGNKWSGNFLNWATMQTIDPFRWALTGGYRSVDTSSLTLLEKAWASGQGGAGNFPNRYLANYAQVNGSTPFAWASMSMRIQGLGNKMRFTNGGDANSGTVTTYDPAVAVNNTTVYELSVRVKVCDTSFGAGGVEANCTAYPAGNYKPTGLIQKYAEKMRYSAFAYLNDDNIYRDGGVLRARQKFVGPTKPVPGSTSVVNSASEWDSNTGVYNLNPDSADATTTATVFGVPVSNSGVINYLNKFGEITPGSYKTYDPVGELYYATIRYFKNLGNVPEWTSLNGADTATKTKWVDGFPVITTWDDPILYACQKNFVLGIGDVNTHADKNVPGPTSGATEPAKPATVTADTSVDAVAATNKVGQLHGLGNSLGTAVNVGGCCNNNSALMAGIAYDSNTKDIRPDDASQPQTVGKQTVQTYWLDILEYQTYKANNQFYLAAKYGGFNVPDGFDPYARSTDIPTEWWHTTTDVFGGQARPDTYFVASNPSAMVVGLQRMFADIDSRIKAYSTSFGAAQAKVAAGGTLAYSAKFDSASWTGDVEASDYTFDAAGAPTKTTRWTFSSTLLAQLAGTGWDTNRRMATWNNATNAGVPFRIGSIAAAQKTALDTAFRSGDDSGDVLNYLRGDKSNEDTSTSSVSARAYRTRAGLVGDIVGSKLRAVGPPSQPYSATTNPGYTAFRGTYASRPLVLYVGTNAGVLHAIDGTASSATPGKELFAYVPGALFQGPSGTPAVNGLQSVANPDFNHHAMVDASPWVYDMDFAKTDGGSGAPDWRSVLIGGLGKGGKAYYAIDVTDPANMSTEAAVAGKVLWEFSHADLGYSYGEPLVVKTKKYGWVVAFGSGYNNADGKGYIFIVNPRTGALLAKLATGAGSTSSEAGLAQVQGFAMDRTDGTVDALYAGDLLGNLWRADVSGNPASYPAPLKLAEVTNGAGEALPITTRPYVMVQPGTNRRYVTVGTGRLLNTSDPYSTQSQVYYAIVDGTGDAFGTAAKLPTGVTYPVKRTNLKQLTDLTAPAAIDLSTQAGWWLSLGVDASGPGWRVLTDSTSFLGTVAFASMVPKPDICTPSGLSRVYAIDLGTGKSSLGTEAAPLAFSTALSGVVTDLRFYSVSGKARLIGSTDQGDTKSLPANPGTSTALRRLNWREIPVAN